MSPTTASGCQGLEGRGGCTHHASRRLTGLAAGDAKDATRSRVAVVVLAVTRYVCHRRPGGLAWEGIANRVRARAEEQGCKSSTYLVGKLGRGVRACPTTALTAIVDTRRSELFFLFPKAIRKFFHEQRIFAANSHPVLNMVVSMREYNENNSCWFSFKFVSRLGWLLSGLAAPCSSSPPVAPLAGSVCFCRA